MPTEETVNQFQDRCDLLQGVGAGLEDENSYEETEGVLVGEEGAHHLGHAVVNLHHRHTLQLIRKTQE